MNKAEMLNIYRDNGLSQVVMGLALMLSTMPVYAEGQTLQCFSDMNKAYSYLMAQEQSAGKNSQQSNTTSLININTATEGELTGLTGIGSRKAQEIIRYREAFGDFDTIDTLVAVKGIGVRTVEKNKSRLTISSDTQP